MKKTIALGIFSGLVLSACATAPGQPGGGASRVPPSASNSSDAPATRQASHLQKVSDVLAKTVTDSHGARDMGAYFIDYFVGGEESAQKKLQHYNAFEVGTNAYTLISLGLKWSLGNPLIASVAGTTAKQLSSVYVPGGQAPYTAALRQVACVQSNIGAAVTYETLYSNSKLGPMSEYNSNLSAIQGTYLAIYAGYRAGSSQPEIAINNYTPNSQSQTAGTAGSGGSTTTHSGGASPQSNTSTETANADASAQLSQLVSPTGALQNAMVSARLQLKTAQAASNKNPKDKSAAQQVKIAKNVHSSVQTAVSTIKDAAQKAKVASLASTPDPQSDAVKASLQSSTTAIAHCVSGN